MNRGVFDGFTVKIFYGEDDYYLAQLRGAPECLGFRNDAI